MKNTMISLTLANTLDQSTKRRVEVSSQQTVKEAVDGQNQTGLASFDVYDGLGNVISHQPVLAHADSTLYIGVQKVVGGGVSFWNTNQLRALY